MVMSKQEFDDRVDRAVRAAHGSWTNILKSLTGDHPAFNGKNQACPICRKGVDRFRYTNQHGEGMYFCHQCGPGGPFKLLQGITGWSFLQALERVEAQAGVVATSKPESNEPPTQERMKKLARKIWNQAVPVKPGDEVDRYLRGRGLGMAQYPDALRFHPALGYFEKIGDAKSRQIAEYPAMLARIDGADGEALTLHRTYLQDGRKAPLPDAKKVLSAGVNGAAVRLFKPTDKLGIAEGIETALAVHLSSGMPVWAGLSAGNLEKLWLPDSVQCICIYADNDGNSAFDGQASAYALARRLKKEFKRTTDRQVQVFVPKQDGTDWADVWLSRLNKPRRVA